MNKSEEVKRHVAHFGAIAFNYSMTGFILTIAVLGSVVLSSLLLVFATLLMAFFYLLLIIGIFVTLGMVLLSDEYRSLLSGDTFAWISNAGDFIGNIAPHIMNVVPILAIITVVLAIISFVCLMFDRKWDKSKSRLITLGIIVISLIVIIVLVLAGVLVVVGGANQ